MNANKDNEEVQEECRVEMKMLEKDSPEFVQFYRMVAQTKNKTFDAGSSDEDNGGAKGSTKIMSYGESQELLERWEALRAKYLPDGDNYAKKSMLYSLNQIINTDKFE